MSIRLYNLMKDKYDNTKPIRGRAVDTRPWDKRTRDKELIIKRTRVMDGVTTYGAKLYNTVVFEIDPSGNITLRTEGWNSNTTYAFLGMVLRGLGFGGCLRRYNRIWAYTQKDYISRAIPNTDLTYTYDKDTDKYSAPLTVITKRFINRQRIKEARAKLKPFKDYCNAILKMSDGFISGAMYKDYAVVSNSTYGGSWCIDALRLTSTSGETGEIRLGYSGFSSRYHDKVVYPLMQANDEALFQPLLLLLSRMIQPEEAEFGVAFVDEQGRTIRCANLKVDIKRFNDLIDRIIKNCDESVWVYTQQEVKSPTQCASEQY